MTSTLIDREQALELASLLCSRLCHDLLSPVGALTNGLELLAEEKDPAMRERCFELLEQSARTSADKLRFFRLAFGAAGGFGDSIPVAEARSLVEALVVNKDRIQLSWSIGADMLPKPAVKTLLNFALIAIDALVRGGTIDLAAEVREIDGIPAAEIVVRAAGARIAFDPAIGVALEGRMAPGDLSSRTAAAAMLAHMAQAQGGMMQLAQAEGTLVMGALLPAA
ncbi:MAG TPA: histidine phosphotransferase family protein [Novosphingobium sp.]|nr:histidine phosphotransferase family protein [Novosphingobium sp.]